MPSPSALFLPEYNCVTITVKLTRFSIKLLSGFIIEQEEQAKQSLCESLHNKLLSVQSALKVCVWLSIVFFSYQFPSRSNNNCSRSRIYLSENYQCGETRLINSQTYYYIVYDEKCFNAFSKLTTVFFGLNLYSACAGHSMVSCIVSNCSYVLPNPSFSVSFKLCS